MIKDLEEDILNLVPDPRNMTHGEMKTGPHSLSWMMSLHLTKQYRIALSILKCYSLWGAYISWPQS